MSQEINNREYRQEILRDLIMQLHDGKTLEEVKPVFEKHFKHVSASEIAEMEQNLIMEGLLPEEIQRLCDVHAAVFKGSIEEIHQDQRQKVENQPGHPVTFFKKENAAIEALVEERIRPHLEAFKENDSQENILALREDFNLLWDIDKHYKRKENLIFPFLERYGITGPPQVMWGVDDEIRADIKTVQKMLAEYSGEREVLVEKIEETLEQVSEMIFKENSILLPMTLDNLTEDDWIKIAEDGDEIGYCLIEPDEKWVPARVDVEEKEKEESPRSGYVKFETGILSDREISAIFNTLPLDITFVDKDGIVKYFSQGKERIFARTKAVIGRTVENCHPPASVHVVKKVVEDLMSGRKDNEDFWIRMGDKYVYIRYFAVRDENGEYLGTLEVSQNIQPIRELEGEKRLLSD